VNSTQAEEPARHDRGVDCVHRLVERQAALTPEAIAVIDGGARISYRELVARSNQLAHALRAAGMTSGARVGVCCERGAGMIVAVLGVLGAGAAYVPIDPAYPGARVALVVADARLAAVVVSPGLAVRFAGLATRAIGLDELAGFPASSPGVPATAGDAMYVLYTSGSTGQPKGVIGLHAAIANRLRWQQEVYPYEPGEVASARTALGFVDSVAEIFAPLAFGVPLVVLGDAAQRDPSRAIAELAAAGATRIVVVPSLLAALLDAVPDLARRAPRLRWWFVGGEPVPVALVERFGRALPDRKLINIYGATELSGDATWFDFDRMPAGLTSSPIGAPLPGVCARVVDGELREVADGEPGEICVSGACVAPGYLDRPELTASRFVPNPFPEGGALYRTRDLGRRLPSGDLQYLGRIDERSESGIGRRAAWNAMPARLFTSKRAGRRVRAWAQRVLPAALAGGVAAHARRNATSIPIALIGAIHAALARIVVTGDPALLVMIDKRDRAELRDVFANLTAVMACHVGDARGSVADVAARVARQLVASAEHSDDLMRRPTLWNDLWARAPAPAAALVRALSARLARRWPDARLDPEILAEYVFAIVPPPERRGGDRRILIAVNILPEVARGAPDATGGFAITHERELPLMLRPGDLVVGTDPLLDRALQIHVTRDARGIVVNLYGGAIDPEGLDELGDAIVAALDELVAERAPAAGPSSERVTA
jgi:amino acid adenylation domain-containing protein